MKNWKKYLALLTALLLVLSFVACTPAEEAPSDPPAVQNENPTEAPVETPTEAPTAEATEPTEETTEASADYTAYMGQWHSGAVTLKIEKDNKWSAEQNGELFLTGQIVVDAEDGSLRLYDMEGTEVADILMDTDNSLYAELYSEEFYDRLEDFFFTREKSDGQVVIDEGYVNEEAPGPDGEPNPGEDSEENISEG